jgi:hypothetical protein
MTKYKRILNYWLLFYGATVFILTSCIYTSQLKGFDTPSWIADHEGCSGGRQSQVELLLTSTDQLIGKSEDRILDILGKPERNELYGHNQKFYIYYIGPGPSCKSPDPDPEMLILRFSAVGICNEIFTQRGFSTK